MVWDEFLNYHNYVLFSLCLPSSVSIFFNFFCPTLSIPTFLPESLCVYQIYKEIICLTVPPCFNIFFCYFMSIISGKWFASSLKATYLLLVSYEVGVVLSYSSLRRFCCCYFHCSQTFYHLHHQWLTNFYRRWVEATHLPSFPSSAP